MSPVIQLGFLLLCLAVADCYAVSRGPRRKILVRDEMMSLGDRSVQKQGDAEEQKGVKRCAACRKLMRRTMPSISRDLERKLKSVCRQFVKAYRPFCMTRAMKIHKSIMDFLFPNRSPYDACIKVRMCKKKRPNV